MVLLSSSVHLTSKFVGNRLFIYRILKRINYNFLQKFAFSSVNSVNLSGVYPPITTPFKDGQISYKDLEHNFTKWNQIPMNGYVILGSNGEFVLLNEEEKLEIIKNARQHISKDKLLIAGSGCESTKATINLTEKMAHFGADVAMVVTPSYYKGSMTEDALYQHYTKVADASPIPVILYSVPSNTSIDLPASVIVKLASHPNIIGIKDSAGDLSKLGHIIHKTKNQKFQVLAGSAGFFLPALLIGCVGGVFALANILGREICELHEFYIQGKLSDACTLQHRLIGPNTAVTRKFSIPGIKAAMDWYGYYGGPPRLPLQPLSSENMKYLKEDFKNNGFL